MDSIFLGDVINSPISCKLHPVVVWSILDHWARRDENRDRVIGVLLGLNIDGLIDIRNCYPVPHTEGDQVALEFEFYKNMFELHKKANPKEIVVGWYATGPEVDEDSVLIHEFFVNEMQHPIHLLIDPTLKNGTLGIKTFVSMPLGIDISKKRFAAQFLPISLEISASDAEKIGIEAMLRLKSSAGNSSGTIINDIEGLEVSLKKMIEMLDSVTKYVDKVLDGSVKPNTNIGRFLADTIASLPRIDSAQFDKMFNNSLQDLLMVVYLANLARTQLVLSEKLQYLVA